MRIYKPVFNVLYVVCFILAVGAIIRQVSNYNEALILAADFEVATKRVALTFDDGPHPVYTPMLLDVLRERGVKATFFVTGENAQMYPDIILQMYQDGHLIGNHSYSHLQLTAGNREIFKEELVRTNEVLFALTGQEVSYVRPPYGSWDKGLERELNMFAVLWSLDTVDWKSQDASIVTNNVLRNVKENDVILMHDCYATTVEAVGVVVNALIDMGFSFVTVDELLFD